MTVPLAAAQGTVTFDLAAGIVRFGGAPAVLAPAHALASLCAAAPEHTRRAFGRAIGEALGRTAVARVAGDTEDPIAAVLDASHERVLHELAAAWSLAGLGALSMERWGRALVMIVDGAPLEGDALLEATLEGAIGATSGRDARAVVINRGASRVRLFVGNIAAAERLRARLESKLSWAEALSSLHTPKPRGGAT